MATSGDNIHAIDDTVGPPMSQTVTIEQAHRDQTPDATDTFEHLLDILTTSFTADR